MTDVIIHAQSLIEPSPAPDANDPFEVDPKNPLRRVWRPSPWLGRLTAALGLMTGLLALLTIIGTVLLARQAEDRFDIMPIVCLIAATIGLACLAPYLWRQLHAARGNAVTLEEGFVSMRPANASRLIPSPADARLRLPSFEIASLECRIEQRPLSVSRVYRLLRGKGSALFLFEERAVGTMLETPSLRPVADAIAAHAGVPMNDFAPAASGSAHPAGWLRRNAELLSLGLGIVAMAITLLIWLDLLPRLLRL